MSVTTFAALSLDESFADAEARDGRVSVPVRRELDVNAFGIYAVRAVEAGAILAAEHDKMGPGADRHEELLFVSTGKATFTVEGETIEAPAGTFVFVRDPESRRAAVADEDGTT